MPFICAGVLFWNMITQLIAEGASVFISSSSYMTQIRRPLTIFLIQALWRNVIMAAHNVIVYVIVAVVLVVVPGEGIILWPFGFVLVLACVSWIALVSGVISARYRDVPVIIANILNILFWLTPIMYFPSQLGSKQYIAEYNPFTHMLALVREPLLGGAPTLEDWLVVLILTVVGWIGTFLFFARFRARIIYWL
jgi:ABC-type polysaccharide/polyol phosphate export permease